MYKLHDLIQSDLLLVPSHEEPSYERAIFNGLCSVLKLTPHVRDEFSYQSSCYEHTNI